MKSFKKTSLGKYLDWYFGFNAIYGRHLQAADITADFFAELLDCHLVDVQDFEELCMFFGTDEDLFDNFSALTSFINQHFNDDIYIYETFGKEGAFHFFWLNLKNRGYKVGPFDVPFEFIANEELPTSCYDEDAWIAELGEYLSWYISGEEGYEWQEAEKVTMDLCEAYLDERYNEREEIARFFGLGDKNPFWTSLGLTDFFEEHWNDEVIISSEYISNKGEQDHIFNVGSIQFKLQSICKPFEDCI